jgi:hypothetical protein
VKSEKCQQKATVQVVGNKKKKENIWITNDNDDGKAEPEKEKEEKEQLLNTMMYGSTWGFDVDVSQRSPAAFVK